MTAASPLEPAYDCGPRKEYAGLTQPVAAGVPPYAAQQKSLRTASSAYSRSWMKFSCLTILIFLQPFHLFHLFPTSQSLVVSACQRSFPFCMLTQRFSPFRLRVEEITILVLARR